MSGHFTKCQVEHGTAPQIQHICILGPTTTVILDREKNREGAPQRVSRSAAERTLTRHIAWSNTSRMSAADTHSYGNAVTSAWARLGRVQGRFQSEIYIVPIRQTITVRHIGRTYRTYYRPALHVVTGQLSSQPAIAQLSVWDF